MISAPLTMANFGSSSGALGSAPASLLAHTLRHKQSCLQAKHAAQQQLHQQLNSKAMNLTWLPNLAGRVAGDEPCLPPSCFARARLLAGPGG